MENGIRVNKNRPDVTNFVTVIIRAYDDEPVRLRVVRFDGQVVDVVGDQEGEPVSFPLQWAYVDEGETYGTLLAAYQSRDSAKLLALWKSAGRFNG